jgi:hypothetical protein
VGDGEGRATARQPRRQAERRQSERSLGRPLHQREYGDDFGQDPGEIDVQRVRRILEELLPPRRSAAPADELDYLERLLKIIRPVSTGNRLVITHRVGAEPPDDTLQWAHISSVMGLRTAASRQDIGIFQVRTGSVSQSLTRSGSP